MKIKILTFGLIFKISVFGQEPKTENSIHNLIQQQAVEIYDSLIRIRRDFHMNPELSGQEQRTSVNVVRKAQHQDSEKEIELMKNAFLNPAPRTPPHHGGLKKKT